MGNAIKAVKGFVVDVGKFIVKKGVSYMGNKIPFVGGWIADKINAKIGGRFAKGGMLGYEGVPDGFKPTYISDIRSLKALIDAFPEQAEKYGITEDKINRWQAKYSPDALDTGKTKVGEEADSKEPDVKIEKTIALKKGGKMVMMSKGGMSKCAKGGSVGIKKTIPWLEHVKAFRATAKGKAMSYSDALKSAKLTYKKM